MQAAPNAAHPACRAFRRCTQVRIGQLARLGPAPVAPAAAPSLASLASRAGEPDFPAHASPARVTAATRLSASRASADPLILFSLFLIFFARPAAWIAGLCVTAAA